MTAKRHSMTNQHVIMLNISLLCITYDEQCHLSTLPFNKNADEPKFVYYFVHT